MRTLARITLVTGGSRSLGEAIAAGTQPGSQRGPRWRVFTRPSPRKADRPSKCPTAGEGG